MNDAERPFRSLEFAGTFLASLLDPGFSVAERRRFVRALALLAANERHPFLRVHQLRGKLSGVWSASASDELRITSRRLDGGRKLLLTCSRHYRR